MSFRKAGSNDYREGTHCKRTTRFAKGLTFIEVRIPYEVRGLAPKIPFRLTSSRSQTTLVNTISEENHSKRGQNREHHGDCLLKTDSTRDGGASQDDRGQKAQFDAVRLAILLPISSKNV